MLKKKYQFRLFADYFQFYIQDEQATGDLSDAWNKESCNIGLAVAPGTLGVGTARNMIVPVVLEIHDSVPNEDFEKWDRVNECSIDVPSGCIVIAGCTDYFPEAKRISVEAQCYRARVYYGGQNVVADDYAEGHDHYRIVLWPASSYTGITILKPVV